MIQVDVSSTGDIQNFLLVNGAHQFNTDSCGVYQSSGFTNNPWGTSPAFATGDPPERRSLNCRHVEEWLKLWESSHSRNDLGSGGFDALDTWLLPDGNNAGTLTIGGNQFGNHVYCKRSWWKHVHRNRATLLRASSTRDYWSLTGSHSGSGTVSGSTGTGTAAGTITGGLGDMAGVGGANTYSMTISVSITSTSPFNATFSGTIAGAIVGTFTGTISAGVVTSVVWTVTAPDGLALTAAANSFTVIGGGTGFTFTGSFSGAYGPETVADQYLRNGIWTSGGLPTLNGIGAGKPYWQNGWAPLVFAAQPATSYPFSQQQVWYGWRRTTTGDPDAHTDWDDSGYPSSNPILLGGTPPTTFGITYQYFNDGVSTIDDNVNLSYLLWVGPTFKIQSGASPNRPQTTLRNIFGWDDDATLRGKITGATDTAGLTLVVGLFWLDRPAAGLNIHPKFFRDSTILGMFGASETDLALSSVLDEPWPQDSNSQAGRRPVFWIGPEWGQDLSGVIQTGSPQGPYFVETSVTGVTSTDSAATAGVNHLASIGGPKVGTSMHPFALYDP